MASHEENEKRLRAVVLVLAILLVLMALDAYNRHLTRHLTTSIVLIAIPAVFILWFLGKKAK